MASLERLYFLTMDEAPIGHVAQVEAACAAGIRWIQLRMKLASDEEMREAAIAAKKICDAYDCLFLINDRVEIAAEMGADGVHLGKQDMAVGVARRILGPGRIIGGTANTLEDIREHCRQGVDYIGLGPYRYTTTKKNLSPVLGLGGYQRIMDQLRREGIAIPVIGIGGIAESDAAVLLETGLYGIAFSGMLLQAEDRSGMVHEIKQLIC